MAVIVTLHERLERLARAAPGADAIVVPGRGRLDRQGLARQIRIVAAHLARLGLGHGDRVVVALLDSPMAATAFLGVSAVTAAAPLNP